MNQKPAKPWRTSVPVNSLRRLLASAGIRPSATRRLAPVDRRHSIDITVWLWSGPLITKGPGPILGDERTPGVAVYDTAIRVGFQSPTATSLMQFQLSALSFDTTLMCVGLLPDRVTSGSSMIVMSWLVE